MRVWARRQIDGALSAVTDAIGFTQPRTDNGPETAALPQCLILRLITVRALFPQVTALGETGPNPLAPGDPLATRVVIYRNADDTKRVTLSVDLYRDDERAAAAFEGAVQTSVGTEGFAQLPPPGIGHDSFAGTVTQGDEVHIGVGARCGNLVVGGTTAGFDAEQQAIDEIAFVTRLQAWKAVALTPLCRCLGRI